MPWSIAPGRVITRAARKDEACVPLLRVVLDTNVVLRGLASERSVAARLLAAAERRRFITLLSKAVLKEYRAILFDPEVRERFPSMTDIAIETKLARLLYVGELIRDVRVRFSLPRDPRDEPFIELAIAGAATHIVSGDSDILDLAQGKDAAAKRFRQRLRGVALVDPAAFMAGNVL